MNIELIFYDSDFLLLAFLLNETKVQWSFGFFKKISKIKPRLSLKFTFKFLIIKIF